jgi:hypothetical protein
MYWNNKKTKDNFKKSTDETTICEVNNYGPEHRLGSKNLNVYLNVQSK